MRVSVCLGDRLDPLPLAALPGCNAGLDFVTIGPNKRVKACSFAEKGFAEDVLARLVTRARATAPERQLPGGGR